MRYNVFYELNGVKHHKVLTEEKNGTYKIRASLTKLGAINIKIKSFSNGTEGKL